MSSLLSRYLHSGSHAQTCCRKALLHNSAFLSKDRFATRSSTSSHQKTHHGSVKNSQQQPERRTSRAQFKRDELPHSGRTPVPERSRRIDTDRWASGNGRPDVRDARRNVHSEKARPRTSEPRRSASFDQRKSSPRDAYGRNSSDTGRTWSRGASRSDSFDKARTQARDTYHPEARIQHRPSPYPLSDRRAPETRRTAPSASYLSTPPRDIPSNDDVHTTFGDGRQDRELQEGAYDMPEAADEFFHPAEPVTLASAIAPKRKGKSFLDLDLDASSSLSTFTSPPLLPGFVSALKEMFGPNAEPTPIQSLSIAHCLPAKPVEGASGWKQFLLASETGSGKSIAYLLPLLQGIKTAELAAESTPLRDAQVKAQSQRLLNPRGLILAPTHELARQLSSFAKALLHDVKLRVLCASRANDKSTTKRTDATSAQMAAQFMENPSGEAGTLEVKHTVHPVSVVVGTPMKLLEMVRGRGWDRIAEDEAKAREEEDEDELDEEGKPRIKPRRGRDKMVHFGSWRAKPELGLANVEWVVVDEADVLFDPDFQETTRTLLADISAARGHILPPAASIPVPPTLGQPTSPSTLSNPLPPSTTTAPTPTSITPIDYPFNLVLTSATIPKSLNAYLAAHHPSLVRLASPRLHRLPKSLQTEYVSWTGGNKFADVVRRIRRVWAEDAASGHATGKGKGAELSKILVFCNRSAKVDEFAAYLETQGVKSVAMTSRSELRGRGSNRHLEGFLRKRSHLSMVPPPMPADPKAHPHVLITTSLLSRGLDFAPDIKHVFIVDEPRNTVDFLHRAGRTGRAGEWGKVVIFGKLKGRGSQRTKEVRKRIQGLRAA